MNLHLNAICKPAGTILVLVGTILSCGCYPGWIVPSRVDVFVKRPVYQFWKTGHLAILPFETPEPSSGFSHEVARIFKQKIIQKKFFKQVTFVEDLTWLNQIEHMNSKIIKAILEARQKNANLVLLGSVEEFIPGTAHETKVTISVKLISVSTGETLWWGKKTVVGKPGDTSLFLVPLLSPDSPDVRKLIYHAADKIVFDIFPDVDAEKKPGFLPGLLEKIKPGERAVKLKQVVIGLPEKIRPGERAIKLKKVVIGLFKKIKPGKRAAKIKQAMIGLFNKIKTLKPGAASETPEEMTAENVLDRALDELGTEEQARTEEPVPVPSPVMGKMTAESVLDRALDELGTEEQARIEELVPESSPATEEMTAKTVLDIALDKLDFAETE